MTGVNDEATPGTGEELRDGALMRRVQAADEAAFGELMEKWELPVKRLLARLVQNSAEADDLAQETFVRVWQQRKKFRAGSAFRPWLFAIAVNLARNRLRWWRRRPAVSLEAWLEAAPEKEPSGSDFSAPARLELRERAESVRAAVAGLPAELREVLVLFEYEELSQRDIAAALGCTPKAVETRLHRAREKLRLALQRWL